MEKTVADGPAGYNGKDGPGNAMSLPTKHYPKSQPSQSGGNNTLEGPGTKDQMFEK